MNMKHKHNKIRSDWDGRGFSSIMIRNREECGVSRRETRHCLLMSKTKSFPRVYQTMEEDEQGKQQRSLKEGKSHPKKKPII